jgi:hypothetical protein
LSSERRSAPDGGESLPDVRYKKILLYIDSLKATRGDFAGEASKREKSLFHDIQEEAGG